MDLASWVINYVKNKDLIHKKLETHTIENNIIHFKFKDKKHDYVLLEKLDDQIFSLKADFITVVCLFNEDNYNFLITNWNKLKIKNNFNLLFVNTEKNLKWLINPFTHDKISDPESLELGLRTMFSSSMQ